MAFSRMIWKRKEALQTKFKVRIRKPEGTLMTYDSVNKWYHYVSEYSSQADRYYYYKVIVPEGTVLYVPSESIEAYKTAPIWDNFTIILPLESLEE